MSVFEWRNRVGCNCTLFRYRYVSESLLVFRANIYVYIYILSFPTITLPSLLRKKKEKIRWRWEPGCFRFDIGPSPSGIKTLLRTTVLVIVNICSEITAVREKEEMREWKSVWEKECDREKERESWFMQILLFPTTIYGIIFQRKVKYTC